MKNRGIALVLIFICTYTYAQKSILVEKIGTSRKYYYHLDDKIKLKTSVNKYLIRGTLEMINDSIIAVTPGPYPIPVHDITAVYKQYGFPRRLGYKLDEAAIVFFLVITFDNLINNQQVFTPYTFIISGSCIAGSLISYSLMEHRCKIGSRWKLKILDLTVK